MTHKREAAKRPPASSQRQHKASIMIDLLNKITSKTSALHRDSGRHRPDRHQKTGSTATGKTPTTKAAVYRPQSMGALDGHDRYTAGKNKNFDIGDGGSLHYGLAQTSTRGLSTPRIPDKETASDVGNGQRPGVGSRSSVVDEENADLNHPRYNRGLSSPDLCRTRHGRRSDVIKGRDRCCSLEALRRSDNCMRTTAAGRCHCTIKLYRPASALEVSAKPRQRMGSGQTGIEVGCPTSQTTSYSLRDKEHISDVDVSWFFEPSPTVWDAGNVMKSRREPNAPLKRSESTNSGLRPTNAHLRPTNASLRPVSTVLRPTNGGLRYGTVENGLSSHLADNGSRTNANIDSSSEGDRNDRIKETLRSNPRFIPQMSPPADDNNGARNGGTPAPSYPVVTDQKLSSGDRSFQKEISTRLDHAPAKPPRLPSEIRVESNGTRSVDDVLAADERMLNTSRRIFPRSCQPVGSFISGSTSGPEYPASTTYFSPRRSGLSPDRDLKSYVYGSEEEKTKVLSLLDRYATKNSTVLPLTKDQMSDYLSCAKRQLGLENRIANLTDNGVDNEREPDVIPPPTELSQQLRRDTDVRRRNTGSGSSNPTSNRNYADARAGSGFVYERRPIRQPSDRVPSIVTFGANHEVLTFKKDNGEPRTRKTRPSCEGVDQDVVVLPQTTFHVNGAITETPAIRRRENKQQSLSNDDNNNNDDDDDDDVVIMASRNSSTRPGRTADGRVISHVPIPSRRLWRRTRSSVKNTDLEESLLQTGMSHEQYQNTCDILDDAIRCSQSLDTLRSWLYGSSMMIIFALVLLLGFLICFGINHVIQISAWVSFGTAVICLTAAVLLMERRLKKAKENLRHTLMKVNSVLYDYSVLCSVVDGRSCKQGTTLYFVHFDIWPCQEYLTNQISDKTSEDLLLTEISRKFTNLFDITSQNLKNTFNETEDFGKKVISKDILMYFAAAYVEDFLLHKKSSPIKGPHPICDSLHDKWCLCNFVKNKVLSGSAVKDLTMKDDLPRTTKVTARKPTLL